MYLGVGFRNAGGLVASNVQGQAARPAASAPLGPWSWQWTAAAIFHWQ
jgi:hypothetical protein